MKIKRHAWVIDREGCGFVWTYGITIRALLYPDSFQSEIRAECVQWLRDNEVFCAGSRNLYTSIHPFYRVVDFDKLM